VSDAAATHRTRTDPYAIVTFALAALWLFGVGSVLALSVGRLSLRRMQADDELRGRTLAWIGIAVAILGLLYAVLWLSLSLTA
jgi:hypothetical protein